MEQGSSVDPTDINPRNIAEITAGAPVTTEGAAATEVHQSGVQYITNLLHQLQLNSDNNQTIAVGPSFQNVGHAAVYQRDVQYNTTHINQYPSNDVRTSVQDLIRKLQQCSLETNDLETAVIGLKKVESVVHPKMSLRTMDDYLRDSPTSNVLSTNFEDIHKEGNNYIVVGESGSGKSTLLTRYYKRINQMSLESSKENAEFSFHIPLKTLDDPNPKYLHEFIFGVAGRKLDDSEKKEVLHWMADNEEKIVGILDGLDQCPNFISKKDNKVVGYFDKCTEEEFIRAIIENKLFSSSKLLLSSRPHAVQNLPISNCSMFHVLCLEGLQPHDVDLLIVEMGGAEIKDELKLKQEIYILCSNPLHLTFVVTAYRNLGDECPDTLTGIILHVVRMVLHSEDTEEKSREKFKKMCSLARDGTLHRKYVFYTEDLRKYGLTNEDVSLFMISKPGSSSLLRQRAITEDWPKLFNHQLFQELFCAVNISLDCNAELAQGFKLFKTYSVLDIWDMFKFLCGIFCNHRNQTILKDILNGLICNVFEFGNRILKITLYLFTRQEKGLSYISCNLPILQQQNMLRNILPLFCDCIAECDDKCVAFVVKDVTSLTIRCFFNIIGIWKLLMNSEGLDMLELHGGENMNLDIVKLGNPFRPNHNNQLCKIRNLFVWALSQDDIFESLALLINKMEPKVLSISYSSITTNSWKRFVNTLKVDVKFTQVNLICNKHMNNDMVLTVFGELLSHIEGILAMTDDIGIEVMQLIADTKKNFEKVMLFWHNAKLYSSNEDITKLWNEFGKLLNFMGNKHTLQPSDDINKIIDKEHVSSIILASLSGIPDVLKEEKLEFIQIFENWFLLDEFKTILLPVVNETLALLMEKWKQLSQNVNYYESPHVHKLT